MMDSAERMEHQKTAIMLVTDEKPSVVEEFSRKSVDAAIKTSGEQAVEIFNEQIHPAETADTAQLPGQIGPFTRSGSDEADVQVNVAAPAILRKWRSLAKERVTTSLYGPYLVADGTLD